jgi:hypothetical protein
MSSILLTQWKPGAPMAPLETHPPVIENFYLSAATLEKTTRGQEQP